MNASRYTIARERDGMGQIEWSDQLIKVSDAVDIIRHLPSVTPISKSYKPQESEEENKKEKHTCISCRFYRYDRRTWPCDDCLDYDRWKEVEE
jgi:hypothetical protein